MLKSDAIEVTSQLLTKNDKQNQSNRQDEMEISKINWSLYVSSFAANLTYFAFGYNMVWTSPVLAKLKSTNPLENPLGSPITSSETSIIAGLPFIGSFIGPLFLGQLCDIYGRKNLLTLSAAITLISYILLALTKSIYIYYLSRFILGLCQGVARIVLPIFITEITEKHNRGKFGCLSGLFVVMGSLYGYVVGIFFSIKTFSLVCAAPMIICILLMIAFVPESPYYLVFKGNTEKAMDSLKLLRNTDQVLEDYTEIQLTLATKLQSKSGVWTTLRNDTLNQRAFIINNVINLVPVLSGITALLAFVGPILDSTKSGISGNVAAIIVAAVKVVTFVVTSSIVEKTGRKKLLILSSSMSGLILILLAIFYYLNHARYQIVDKIQWLPIVLVIVFTIFYSIGLGPLPPVVMNELQPSETRSLAASLITSIICATSFIVTSGFPFMIEFLGYGGCFLIFGSCCILGSIYMKFFLVETKGKTLLEIQEIMKVNKLINS